MKPPVLAPGAPLAAAAPPDVPRTLRPNSDGEATSQGAAFDIALAIALAANLPVAPPSPAVPAMPDWPATARGEVETAQSESSGRSARLEITANSILGELAVPANSISDETVTPSPPPSATKPVMHGPALDGPAAVGTPEFSQALAVTAPAAASTTTAPVVAATLRAAPGAAHDSPRASEGAAEADDTAKDWIRQVRQGRRTGPGAIDAAPRREGGGEAARPDIGSESNERKPAGSSAGTTDPAAPNFRGSRGRDRSAPSGANDASSSAPPADGSAPPAIRTRAEGASALRTGDGLGTAGGSAALRDHLESRPARASEFVTVSFTDGSESGGRVRLSMRGDTLRATILSSEAALLDRLEPRLDQLRRSLADRGFDQPLVALRTIATTEGTPSAQEQHARRERGGEPRDRDASEKRERHGNAPEGDGRRSPRDTGKGR